MRNLVEESFAPCAEYLGRVDGALLDCVSDDIALLLAAHGVDDVRDPFARDWRFDLLRPKAGLTGVDIRPEIDLPAARQDDLIAARTGYRPAWQPIDTLPQREAAWRDALRDGEPVLLVGDAYHLPWLPYHDKEHMDHGFVLEGITGGDGPEAVAHVVDPYDNATEWGRAEPLATTLPLTDLAPAVVGGRWAVLAREPGDPSPVSADEQLTANANAIVEADEQGSYQRFHDGYQGLSATELEGLTLQTWLLARDRGLHALWLADQPAGSGPAEIAGRFAEDVAAGWRRAAEATYIALRRVRSGRQAPASALATVQHVMTAETGLAREITSHARTCDQGGQTC
jgi:hypothetical protein